MKKVNVLFIIWGIIVVFIIALLTTLGFLFKSKSSVYEKLEDKLVDSAKKYVDTRFLYPSEKEDLKVTSKELIESELLDELRVNDEICNGYVIVTYDSVFHYKAYIQCKNYTTKGYKK